VRIEDSIEALRQDLARYCTEAAKIYSDHEQRIRELEQNEAIETRLRNLETSDAQQNVKLGLVAGALAILQIITSAIAAWIGATM